MSSRPTSLNDKTMLNLTIGGFILILMSIGGGIWTARGYLEEFKTSLDKVEEAARASWSYSMQKEWSDKLKISNPTIIIPDPVMIRKDHIDAQLLLWPAPPSIVSTLDACTEDGPRNLP